MAQPITGSTILRTPLDIYESAKQHFPAAKAIIRFSENNQFKVELTLSENVQPLVLSCAVDSNAFSKDLDNLVWQIAYNKLIKNQRGPLAPLAIDASRFSILGQQLTDWQRFQCAMHEKSGHSCADTIIKYLQNPEQESTALSGLGLTPDQVEKRLSNAEIEYFVQVISKLRKMTPKEGDALFDRLKAKYPSATDKAMVKISERERLDAKKTPTHFEEALKKLQMAVFGQELAVKKLASFLSTQKNGKDNGFFLFVGPTGVGKTELAKAVAGIKSNRFVMLQMNQYTSSTDVSKLFGSSAGYIGSEDVPHMAKEFDKWKPAIKNEDDLETRTLEDVVILFDEFEKAHPQVKQSLLSLFDIEAQKNKESFIKVSYTQRSKNINIKYIFRNCIFICTSNLYQQEILEDFQQGKKEEEIREHFIKLNQTQPLISSYSPELLGRAMITPFGPIPKGEVYQKLLKAKLTPFLEELKKEFACREVVLGGNESSILSALEDKLYGNGVDLRRIKQYFNQIKQALHANQPPQNLLKAIKITFFIDKDRLSIRLSHFIEPFAYVDIDPIIYVDNVARL